ncbi:carboxypeptidase regulatory-like domain-containing protein [Halosimplex rubrum]|uniref:Carboxypeptidase regulatory-like domain-containing protein n=1 Tax=Halosimplex rubrum TaxID=869889 RepID=A0A7D5P2N7_9EURY|nr:carboxypeptidase regulatory-like domain-containing protein [Halosimplex rubrum]QLH76564.1 carboxypeptidase regulatory-like domain-containing protein [Halosimplex rubrum]
MRTQHLRTATRATATAALVAVAILALATGGAAAAEGDAAGQSAVAAATAPGGPAATGPSASVAAANVTANRTGPDNVTISVQQGLFPPNTSAANATVTLSAPGRDATDPYPASGTQSGAFVYRVPLADLSTAARDLGSATVAVTPGTPNATAHEVSLDLRSLSFGSADNATLNESTLSVPVDRSLGVVDGAAIAVSAGFSESGPVTQWTAHLDGNGTGRLTVPLARFNPSRLLNETLALQPQFGFEPDAQLAVNPREAAGDATVNRIADGLAVRHPLLFESVRYAVTVDTTDPDGSYVRAHTPAQRGRLALPGRLLIGEQRRITVDAAAHSTAVFSVTHTVSRPERVVNGTALNVSGLVPSGLRAVWVDNGTAVTKLSNSTTERGALALPADLVGNGVESVLLQGETLQPVGIADVVGTASAQQTGAADGATAGATATGTDGSSGTTTETATGNATGLVGAGTTAADPTLGLSALAAPLIALVVGVLCFGIGYLLEQNGDSEHGATGGLLAFFAVFGAGLGYWLGGSSASGALLFELAAIAGGVVFGAAYLGVGAVTRTRPASQRNQLAALLVATTVPLAAAALLVAFASDLSLLAAGGAYSAVAGGLVGVAANTAGGASGEAAAAGAATRTATVTVRLVDDQLDRRVRDAVEVTVTRASSFDPQTEREPTSDGTAAFDLSKGTYTVEATYGGRTESTEIQVDRDDRSVELRFSPRAVAFAVQDTDERPLPDADVTVVGDDGSTTRPTDADGRLSFDEIPAGVDSLDVSVSRPGYAEKSLTVSVGGQRTVPVELEPLTGTLRATATLDGRPVDGFSVTVTPERVDAVGETDRDAETDGSGRAQFDDLAVGEYSVGVSLPQSLDGFGTTDATVTVEEDRTATVDVPVVFEFDLSRAQRDRVSDVRATLADISSASTRDTAIPAYYASVVERVLETAESIPDSGHPFLVHRTDPSAVVDALLDATEAAADQIDEAMGSKRNVDLFSACSDLPDADIEWQGSIAVDDTLALAERGVGEQRGRFADRLDTVDEGITDELSGLAEISPAREMWDSSRTLVRESTGVDTTELDSAAAVVTAEALLDAVEQLFEHEPLRKRMKQTVF